jgi:hypothetical protein
MRNLGMITIGQILEEIELEGRLLGHVWKVPRLYVTRNEASEKNIAQRFAKLKKKTPNITRQEVIKTFFFSPYRNKDGIWRIYSKEESDDLKQKIKEKRRFV